MQTHSVLNQVSELDYSKIFLHIPLLKNIFEQNCSWALKDIERYCEALPDKINQGILANQYKPVLQTHDRFGNRIDQVEFHPAYHQLMQHAMQEGCHNLPWVSKKAGRLTLRCGLMFLNTFADPGTCCPLSMTFAAFPALNEATNKQWQQKLLKGTYDPRFIPIEQKQGITLGMGMTEKQGGSDVRANITKSVRQDDHYLLTGHKWFCSAPMSDAFLVTAQSEDGIGCFLVPRFLPDETVNPFYLQRLKNKLGNHSNASSEVEFHNTYAEIIGNPGEGIKQIIKMVALTRLDCLIGSTALMSQAVIEAIHHARERKAFGQFLMNQPLMRQVLADLKLEMKSAISMAFKITEITEQGLNKEHDLTRLVTALGKYWLCKRAPMVINEAQECLGGAGYVEETLLPRIYREAPLNSIWEGCGNIQCLDVQRMVKQNRGWEEFCELLTPALDANNNFKQFYFHLKANIDVWSSHQEHARLLTETMAKCLQGLSIYQTNEQYFEGYCTSRLSESHTFGSILPKDLANKYLIDL